MTVVTKLTLTFSPGGLSIARDQEPLCHAIPSLFGNPLELHHPSDFVPRKSRCDVILTGSAYAAMPLAAIAARVRVGSLLKRFFALAGEQTTAIPLSVSYLRTKRRFDSEEVTVSGLSPEHPFREGFLDVEEALSGAPLSTMAIPGDFDFGFYNSAPEDQQVAFLAPGTPLSLEGLSPDGAPCGGPLPDIRPQIFALSPDGARIAEVPLVCDTLWIDTDRKVVELTFRGTVSAAPAKQARKGRFANAHVMPLGLVVRLRDPAEKQRELLLADLPRALATVALFPEDVPRVVLEEPQELGELDFEEVEDEVSIEALESSEGATTDRKPLQNQHAVAPFPIASETPPRETPVLGRLGAMQLHHAGIEPPPLVIAPALVVEPPFVAPPVVTPPGAEAARPLFAAPVSPPSSEPKRSATLTMAGNPALRRPRTLPFGKAPSELTAIPPLQPPPPVADDPLRGRRPRTLELSPDARGRAALPFEMPSSEPILAPSPTQPVRPITMMSRPQPDGGSSRRPRTLDLSPGSSRGRALPFLGSPETPQNQASPLDPESARARFLALTKGPNVSKEGETLSLMDATSDVTVSAPVARNVLFPLNVAISSPGAESAPWAEKERRPSTLTGFDAVPISRVGVLSLDVDAAIQQEIWRGELPLHEILSKHGVGEIAWREHLRRRDEVLRDESEKGATARARAEKVALDRARQPLVSEVQPSLDLEGYAHIRALLEGASEGSDEAQILANRGIEREVWDRDHHLYRKRLREEPVLAERFRAAVADAKKQISQAPNPSEDKRKPISKKPSSGALGSALAGVRAPARSDRKGGG